MNTTKLVSQPCANCGKQYRASNSQQRYCTLVCTQSAKRVRDREGKHNSDLIHRDPWLDHQTQVRNVIGKCRYCKRTKQLRLDSYGLAADPYLDVDPEFCSERCAVNWWKAQANAPSTHDVYKGLWRLIYPDEPYEAELESDDEEYGDHWEDRDEDEPDPPWFKYGD